MADHNSDKGTYEFDFEENQVLLILSRSLHKLGRLIFVAGLLFVIYLVVAYLDPESVVVVSDTRSMLLNAVDYGLWIVIALLVMYLSVMVIHLALPIRLIVETTGADMTNLMHFLRDLTRMIRICFSTLLVVCVLMAISLVLLIVVF
jgi:hypothetical protein